MRENTDMAEVVRSEERLTVTTDVVPVERVRLVRSVVTELRTVEVRREELRIEREPLGGEAAAINVGPDGVADLGPTYLEIVLHEEEVLTRTVPRERVRIYVDRATGEQHVQDTVRQEVVSVEMVDGGQATRS